jgi:undecaprenyl-diphosphatase
MAAPDELVDLLDGTPASETRPATSPLAEAAPGSVGDLVNRFDRRVDRWFDANLGGKPAADRLFYGASALGDFALLWQLIAASRALGGGEREKEALRLSVALGVESIVINGPVKAMFRRQRPVWDQDRPRTLRKPRSSSFPSGHATSGFMAASLLAAGRPRQRPLWYAVASVVAASRVHVKIHHASDVAAGAAIGIGLGALVRRIAPLGRGAGNRPT